MSDDAQRDPVAEQDEAARAFLEATGRKSTDPSPTAVLHMRAEVQIEQTPNAIVGHFPGGTDPRAAIGKVFAAAQHLGMLTSPASKYPDAIEADVIEDEPETE